MLHTLDLLHILYVIKMCPLSSSLMQAFTEQLNIKMIMVSPTDPKSLLAEHGIKSLSNLLVKHLTKVGSWPECLPLCNVVLQFI